MFNVFEKENSSDACQYTLTLPFDLRQKSRLRAKLDNGVEAALQLKRGTILRSGDVLKADSGELILVQAALENVSTAFTENNLLFARACYHLGNRHVPLQIEENCLHYQSDHVLDHMLIELGLDLKHELIAFEPESGAYQAKGNSQTHTHGH
ncbi:MAG: urease accessory protein UreE [Gammaproteobacteria bacterium]|nr:urease accessory protein UreE [Gammaproteobacteria bacterium]